MELKMTINGVPFERHIRRSGLVESEVTRRSREVITADGTAYRAAISKRRYAVSLLDMSDTVWATLRSALPMTGVVRVEITGTSSGEYNGDFYVTGMSVPAGQVIGGRTYFSGINFNLEER